VARGGQSRFVGRPDEATIMSGLGMIACDTNILFPALEASHPDHRAARAWLESMVGNESFALCELVLTEVYTLLRNAAICAKPLA
jgi:predicted nucleic acid-binding protein